MYIQRLIQEYCPNGVEYKALGEVCKRQKGIAITAGEMKKLDKPNGVIRIFAAGNTVANVNYGDIQESGIIKKPSIIVKSRGNIGFEYYEKPFSHKNEMWSYSSNINVINLKFVYYYLQNHIDEFQKKAKTGKLPQIATGDTDNFRIPVPPIEIQNKIVSILDKFTELIDSLKIELSLRKKQYEYYKSILLTFGDEIPKYKLSELFNTRNGYTPSKSNKAFWRVNEISWFRMEDIREHGGILNKALQGVSMSAIKGKPFPKNSIIVSTSATIGEHALIKCESLANQRFTYLMLKDEYKDKYNIMFLFYYCFVLDEYCKENLNKGNFASVDMRKFNSFMFPMPPLEEQERIVAILDKFDALRNDIHAEIELRKKQYEYYREKLLQF